MFELFGSSSEKKEEIDQNVEDIKDMVEGKEPPRQDNVARTPQEPAGGQQGPQATEETGQQSNPLQAQGRQPPKTGPSQNMGQPPQQPENTGQQTQEEREPVPDRQEPKTRQKGTKTTQNTADSPQNVEPRSIETAGDDDLPPPPGQPRNTGQSPQEQSDEPDPATNETQAGPKPEPAPARREPKQGSSDETDAQPSQDIPTAPETKEINVPEIEKGPLFIRVKKFKESKKLINEMQDLAEDVETDMGGLKNTLEEDREVRKDLKSRLKRLQDSMKSVHTIISP